MFEDKYAYYLPKTLYLPYHVFTISVPEGLNRPTLLSDTSTSVVIVWGPPSEPNGDIVSYTIQRRQIEDGAVGNTTTVVTLLSTNDLRYRDTSTELIPYTTYEYRIIATNTAGQGVGEWVRIITESSSKYNKSILDQQS